MRRLVNRLAGRDPGPEDERLVELFRNRAELKKELNAIDDERHRLLDRLKLQEGATMRAQEQFDALEQYLGHPDEGYKSLAYFQLRAVWRNASGRLEKFAAELARQQKDRERRTQLADFERTKQARAAEVERELTEARVLADQLQAEQKLARQRLAGLRGFWNYFRKRELTEEIESRATRIEASLTQVTDLSDRMNDVQSEPPPRQEGISIEGRRAVNLAVIAYAEALCERFSPSGLAEAARQTTLRRVYDTIYGGRDECLALMQTASRALAELDRTHDDLADIKARTDRLRRTATYRGPDETVPTPDSIQPPVLAGGGSVPNVLLDEYWDVYKALVR
jgi:chromosome segregation ATPase